MKITVVGVGAMGSIYAGLLADAGHEVWVIDIWKEHIDAIKEKGLRITGASHCDCLESSDHTENRSKQPK